MTSVTENPIKHPIKTEENRSKGDNTSPLRWIKIMSTETTADLTTFIRFSSLQMMVANKIPSVIFAS